jgi:hypothetical protein
MAQVMGAIGIGATIAGGTLAAHGAEQTGIAQQRMYDYQAGVAKINSQIDLQNRDYALHVGDEQNRQYGMHAAQTSANIKSAQAASGIDVNSGSAVKVRNSETAITHIDESQIRENASKVAYDYETKSGMDLNQATLDTMAGTNAKMAGDINSEASIIGTVGSVASKWSQGSQMGMFGGSGGISANTNGSGVGFVSGL